MKLLQLLLLVMLALPTLQTELKILSLPSEEAGPAPCSLICSGVSKHDTTDIYQSWQEHHNKVYKRIDIEECGFVSSPVVTVAMRGRFISDRCPPIRIQGSYSQWFGVVTTEDATTQQMSAGSCDVFWTANGFSC